MVLCIMALLSYVRLSYLERVTIRPVIQELDDDAAEMAEFMENWLADRGATLKVVAMDLEFYQLTATDPRLPAYFHHLAGKSGSELNGIYVNLAQQTDGSARPLADQTRELVITDPYKQADTGKWALSLRYPVKTPVPGTVGMDVLLSDLLKMIAKQRIHQDAKAMIVSRDGTVFTTEGGGVGESLATMEGGQFAALNSYLQSSRGVYETMLMGVNHYASISPATASGWRVILYVPKAALTAKVDQVIAYSGAVFFGLLAIVMMILYILIARLTSPLKSIVQTAEQMGTGNFNVTFHGTGSQEVEQLVKSLNAMREQFEQLLCEKEDLWEVSYTQTQELAVMYDHTYSLNATLEQAFRDIEKAYMQTIKALTEAIEAKDYYTRGHSERVLVYSEKIAAALGWTDVDNEEELVQLRYAAILHDIGKIGIDTGILNKPGRLTDEEYTIIREHPTVGWRILQNIERLRVATTAVVQHHERIDGSGYPQGLKGEEITLLAKILSVADTYDAMTSERPYRAGLPQQSALAELRRCAGTQFDEEIVAVFCEKVVPQLLKKEA